MLPPSIPLLHPQSSLSSVSVFFSLSFSFSVSFQMDCSDSTAATNSNSCSSSPRSLSPSSSSSPLSPTVVLSPCAACKILRRRCADKCVLAPYFPPTEPAKFTTAHRVFGASNIIKFLQELPESQRADAVSSMVYEAQARIRDPVYGCAGAICQLQKHVSELQAQLAKAQAELVNMQCQQANLVAVICMGMSTPAQSPQPSSQESLYSSGIISPESYQSDSCFLDDINIGAAWEPLWT